MTAIC